jgi:hypothetical protein
MLSDYLPLQSITRKKKPTSATWWTLLRAVNGHGSRVCAVSVCMCLLLFVNSAPTILDSPWTYHYSSLLINSRINVPCELEREGQDTKAYAGVMTVTGWWFKQDGHWFPKKKINLLYDTPSGLFYLAQIRMIQSPKLYFDHSFALYYIIYGL